MFGPLLAPRGFVFARKLFFVSSHNAKHVFNIPGVVAVQKEFSVLAKTRAVFPYLNITPD
jgi:hypothetical protein